MSTNRETQASLRRLTGSKPSIGFATQDRSIGNLEGLGGAGYYRCGLPAAALAANGYDARVGLGITLKDGPFGIIPARDATRATQEERCERAWFPDIIVMQRYMQQGAEHLIRTARACGQVIINDVDDLLWNMPVTNRAFRAVHPSVHPEANINHYRKILAASSVVTVSTPFLRDQLHAFVHDAPIEVVRNAIDMRQWATHEHREPPRLGWSGALSHRSNDVEQIAYPVRQVVGAFYDKQFVHCGSIPDEHIWDVIGLDSDECVEHPMVPIEQWPHQLRHFDVGVVPLNAVAFNKAKSAIKGMEYAAAGIPFVASHADEYVWLYGTHGIGRLARKPKHWATHLRALADPEVRHAEAREQREKIWALDIGTRWREWESLYLTAIP